MKDAESISKFIDRIYEGIEIPHVIYMAVMKGGDNDTFKPLYVPSFMKSQIPTLALKAVAEGMDVYYNPSIYPYINEKETLKATRENALGGSVLYVDFDEGKAPDNWAVLCEQEKIPLPTMVVQSSVAGNQHAYWKLDKQYSTQEIEDKNQALALKLGADRSGWDINQLLRLPFTKNFGHRTKHEHKPWYEGEPVDVKLLGDTGTISTLKNFDIVAKAEKELLAQIKLGPIPTYEESISFGETTDEILRVANLSKEDVSVEFAEKRSGGLMYLAYLMAEQIVKGFTDEQMYSILEHVDAKWEKYSNRSETSRHKALLTTLTKARAKYGYPMGEGQSFDALLSHGTAMVEEPEEIKHTYSFLDFLDLKVEVKWLIKERVPESSLGFIVGDPAVGKTQFALNMALMFASGKDFYGWSNVKGPVKTLFMSLEMASPTLLRIFKKISTIHMEDSLRLDQNLSIAPLGTNIPLDTNEGVAYMQYLIDTHKPEVVFVDSLQRSTNTSMADEMGMKILMNNISTLRDKNKCAFIFIHHNRKRVGGMSKKEHVPDLDSLYGSQFISANADWVVGITREEGGLIAMRDFKQRLTEEISPMYLRRTENLNFEITTHETSGEDDGSLSGMLTHFIGKAKE